MMMRRWRVALVETEVTRACLPSIAAWVAGSTGMSPGFLGRWLWFYP
jgi:hypothetical protein